VMLSTRSKPAKEYIDVVDHVLAHRELVHGGAGWLARPHLVNTRHVQQSTCDPM
jgi:hypothetical protein